MAANLSTFALLGFLAIILPLTGVFMALTPYLMPKRECFAVTIPATESNNPRIKQLKRNYCLITLAATTVLSLGTLASMLLASEETFLVAFTVSVLAICLGGYALMLLFRAKTQELKRQQGWEAAASVHASFIAEEAAPKPLSLKWDLLFLPGIVLSLAMAIVSYPLMPDRIPMQMNFAGEVGSWADKSPAIAAFPALISALMAACFVFSHWSILRSKKGTDAARPAASAWAYGAFARAESMVLVALGAMFSLLGPLMCLAFCGIITLQQTLPPILFMAAVAVVASFGVSAVYGQNGSRLLAKLEEPAGMPADDDAHWKLGLFYCNREDASLFVPERFGVGWGMNYGRPAAWAIIIAFTLMTAAFIAFSLML